MKYGADEDINVKNEYCWWGHQQGGKRNQCENESCW